MRLEILEPHPLFRQGYCIRLILTPTDLEETFPNPHPEPYHNPVLAAVYGLKDIAEQFGGSFTRDDRHPMVTVYRWHLPRNAERVPAVRTLLANLHLLGVELLLQRLEV